MLSWWRNERLLIWRWKGKQTLRKLNRINMLAATFHLMSGSIQWTQITSGSKPKPSTEWSFGSDVHCAQSILNASAASGISVMLSLLELEGQHSRKTMCLSTVKHRRTSTLSSWSRRPSNVPLVSADTNWYVRYDWKNTATSLCKKCNEPMVNEKTMTFHHFNTLIITAMCKSQ